MKKIVIPAVLFLVAVVAFFTCRERIPPGYAGARINYYGSGAGVDPIDIKPGVVFYQPWSQSIVQYPTTEQWVLWTQEDTKFSPGDESITFSDKNGATVNGDLAISLHFVAEKIPVLYEKTRRTYEDIAHQYLRILVRGKINRESEKLDIIEVFGSERSKMLDRAKQSLNSDLAEIGIEIDTMDFQGQLRVSDAVKTSIDRVIVAGQNASEAEQKVKQIIAEAEQAKAKAEGESESILINAKKQAEANRVLTESLTPELIKYRAVEKWDGILPRMTGEVIPFVGLEK